MASASLSLRDPPYDELPMHYTGTEVPCPLCDAPPTDHRPVGTRSRDGSPLRTVLCVQCGLAFTNPMPTLAEVSDFYRDTYRRQYKRTVQPRPKHVLRAGRRAVERLRRIEALAVPPGRLLDVGSGGGEFLHVMRHRGFTVQGIEPNLGYAAFSRHAYGLEVTDGTLESADAVAGPFDLITVHHVLEHLRDPLAALRSLAARLAPDGMLIIEVPNLEATYHAPSRRFHFAHLLHFAPATLTALGERAGLHVTDSHRVPVVEHVNIAFRKGAPTGRPTPLRDADRARTLLAALRRHTPLRHLASIHPWRRVVENLARPLEERHALRGTRDAAGILDHVLECERVSEYSVDGG